MNPQRILRVFAAQTSACPVDDATAFAGPTMFDLKEAQLAYSAVHVSVTFTWDVEKAKSLARAWGQIHPNVLLGGPALGSPAGPFVAGRYLKQGLTFTSRGCPKRCPWCFVPSREGTLTELPDFPPGNVIQDNNLAACSRPHLRKVFDMLRRQPKAARFMGGLDASRMDGWFLNKLKSIRIRDVWLAADDTAHYSHVLTMIRILRRMGLRRRQVRCYCLIGFGGESKDSARGRLQAVWDAGAVPFAQLYEGNLAQRTQWPKEWRRFARTWSRPAAMFALAWADRELNEGQ